MEADESGEGDDIEGVPVVAAVREALSGADTLEEGVRRVLAEIGESLGWLFGACWHVDGGVLCVRQTWCARAYHSTSFEADSRAHAFHSGEGLPGRVWATGRPVWVEDVRVEVNFPRHAAAAREGLRAAVAFPLQCDGKLYGVLEFYTDWLRTPTPALLPVFDRLGEEIGRCAGTAPPPAGNSRTPSRGEQAVHGIVMNQFRQYVTDRLGRDAWFPLSEAAGVPPENHRLDGVYPDEQIVALVLAASRLTGQPLNQVLEDFGVFIAPALLRVYAPLIDPEWRTLDVIEHTEETIHTVVRSRMPGATPPALLARRVSPAEVQIDYRSKRGLCSLAEGIARGMALHFGEAVDVDQPECVHRGDERCLISVRLVEGAPAE